MATSINDLRKLFWGGGQDAEIDALTEFSDAGYNSLDLFSMVGESVGTLPTGALGQACNRDNLTNQTALASQRQHFNLVYLRSGISITSITWLSGTTALGTPSNQFAGLYSLALAKLAVTADRTTDAWAANSAQTYTFATPYAITTSGLYYLTLCVNATQVPSLACKNSTSAAGHGIAPIRTGADATNTTITTPASAPNPAAALTATTNLPYCYYS